MSKKWEGIDLDTVVADVDLKAGTIEKTYHFDVCLRYAKMNPEVCEEQNCIIHALIKALQRRGAYLP